MPQYKATAKTFVNGALVREGQTFHSDEKPSKSWQPVEELAPEFEGEKPDEKKEQKPKAAK